MNDDNDNDDDNDELRGFKSIFGWCALFLPVWALLIWWWWA